MIVLKILLWTILGILAFILLVLLYVLFAPIGYDIRGQWDGSRDVRFRIHDFLHSVSAVITYRLGEGLSVTVMAFGFFKVVDKHPGDDEAAEEESAGPDDEENEKSDADVTDAVATSSEQETVISSDTSGEQDVTIGSDISGGETGSYIIEETDTSEEPHKAEKFEKPGSPYDVNYRDVTEEEAEAADSEDKDTISEDEESASETGSDTSDNKDSASEDDEETSEEGSDKRSKQSKSPDKKEEKSQGILDYLTKENYNAVKYILRCVLKLIKKLLPHIKSIDGTYSIGSPDLTGQLFGVLTMMPALYKKGNSLIPDFESETIYYDGMMEAEGKIVPGWFVAVFIKVMLHKDSRTLVFSLLKANK